jgi:hypothetical protein
MPANQREANGYTSSYAFCSSRFPYLAIVPVLFMARKAWDGHVSDKK